MKWATNYHGGAAPYFDHNSNGIPDMPPDYVVEDKLHVLGKSLFSRQVLHALLDNGALTELTMALHLNHAG